jgi:hypothetical protein
MTANILKYWSITELRYAFPVQLRPRPGTSIAPALIAALSDLSKISRGQLERVKVLLRDAVHERYRKSKALGEAVVTIADIQKVRARITAQLGENGRGQSPPRTGNYPNITGSDSLAAPLQSHQSKSCSLESLAGQDVNSPLASYSVVLDAAARPSRSSSFPRLEDIGVDLARPVDNGIDSPLRATGETMTSSPPIKQQERASLALLRRKQLEADMHRLLAQENDHKRQAEEYRIRATRHDRKALALRMQVAEMEAEMQHPGDNGWV